MGRPKKPENEKAKPTDRIICEVCGGEFGRSGRYRHNHSKIHQSFLKIQSTIRNVVNEEPKKEKDKTIYISPKEFLIDNSKKSIREQFGPLLRKKQQAAKEEIAAAFGKAARSSEDLDELSDIELEQDNKIEDNKIKSKVYKYGNESNDDSRNEKKNDRDSSGGNLLDGTTEEIMERIRNLAKF